MNYSDGGYSLADIAAATGNNSRNNDGFGDGNAWWIVVFLIFAMFGFGNRGFGNGFGGGSGTGSGATDNYVLASDFATLQRQLDSGFDRNGQAINQVNQGLCDGFYAMNTGMLNGFSGVQQTLCQGFSGVNHAIATNGYENRLATQGLSSQLANCCCDIRQELASGFCGVNSSIKDTNYNMAMNTNALQQSMCNSTRDIIESQNNGTRAILDALTANRIEDKNAQITAQQNEINSLRLAASQERQNSFLISQLNPTPVPSYPVVNPNCCLNYQVTNGCYGNGCNCGNY